MLLMISKNHPENIIIINNDIEIEYERKVLSFYQIVLRLVLYYLLSPTVLSVLHPDIFFVIYKNSNVVINEL